MKRGGGEPTKRSLLGPLMGLFGGAVLLTLALVMFSYSLLFAPGPRADTEVTFRAA